MINELLTRDRVQAVLDELPRLGVQGLSTKHNQEHNKPMNPDYLTIALEPWVTILCTAPRTKTKGVSSYALKHYFEDLLGHIANGQFIVAALIADIGYEIVPHSPNVLLGVSQRWANTQCGLHNDRRHKQITCR